MKLSLIFFTLMASAAALTTGHRLEARRLPDHYIIGENLDGLPDCYACNPHSSESLSLSSAFASANC